MTDMVEKVADAIKDAIPANLARVDELNAARAAIAAMRDALREPALPVVLALEEWHEKTPYQPERSEFAERCRIIIDAALTERPSSDR